MRALSRTRVLTLRAMVLVVATVLRLVGIGFTPSTPWGRPDEEIFATVALRLFSDRSPHTAETGWPELWFRVHHGVQALLRAVWAWRDGADPDLGCAMVLSPSQMLVPVRVLTALLSVATVWLVMRLARRVGPKAFGEADREAVSLIAGGVMAVDVLVMRDAHYAVSDTALVFFLAWMLLAAARGLDEGRVIDFASCGVALGLAIGTKWTGLTFGVVPVAALAARVWRFGAHPSNVVAVLVGTASTVAAFLLTNPSFVTSAQPFLDGIAGQAVRYDPNAPQVFTIFEHAPIELGLTRHLRVSLPFALGWPLTIVALLGTVHQLVPRARAVRGGTWLAALFTLVFHVVVAGRTTMYFARYSLPIHPGLAVASALAIVLLSRALADRIARAGADVLATRLALAATLLLTIEPAVRALEFDLVLARPETRDVARAYLRAHVDDAPVDVSGGYSRLYAVTPRLARLCEERLPESLRGWMPRLGSVPDASWLASGGVRTWPTVAHDAITGEIFGGTHPYTSEWAMMTLPYLPCGHPVQRFGAEEPRGCYREVARFEPEGIACDAVWDDQDHLYAPLWGWETGVPLFSSASTPLMGPRLVLYRRECPE